MRNIILAILITTVGYSFAQTDNQPPKVQFTFLYPIGSAGANSASDTFNVSFNLLAGATSGIQGIELSGFGGFTNGSVTGAQLAGFGNVVRDSLSGVQLAGFANTLTGNATGVQGAGFANVINGELQGGQVAGFANYCRKEVRGAQLSGFASVTTDKVTGVQGAGFANYSHGLQGLQAAGFANVNTDTMKGNQIAGFVNVSTRPTEGAQIAGFINVATKIKGGQLGFINYADSLDGVSVGFFSYAKNGYHQFELSGDETFQTQIGFRTGTNHFYNQFFAGAHWSEENPVWAFGYGVGTRKELSKGFALSLDAISYSVLPENFQNAHWESLNKLKLSLSKTLGYGIDVFAGASYNIWVSDVANPQRDYLPSAKYGGENGSTHWIMYPGFQFGFRI